MTRWRRPTWWSAVALVVMAAVPSAAARATGTAGTDVQMHRIGGGNHVRTLAAGGARYLVMVDDAPTLDALLARADVHPSTVWRSGFRGFASDLDTATATVLRTLPGVRSVELDGRVQATATQTDPPWGLDRIDQATLPLDAAYTSTTSGSGVTAYVIDSGAWMTHTEISDRIPYAYYWDYGDGTEAWDCNGHGTHVAGTLGGATFGVAKDVTIVPVKMLDCDGSGSDEAMLSAIDAVISDHQPGQPAVVNMSVGGDPSAALDSAVRALIDAGITVVAAAGNEGVDACTLSPARVHEVITVGASDQHDRGAAFSNHGSCNDLFAPGVEVLSAWTGDDQALAVADGTSMAAPHVAGVAALVLESSPAASPADVWATIDAAAVVGMIDECCGDPDKLLQVPMLGAPPTRDLATVQPARLYDSRTGDGPRPPGSVTAVQVGGRAGVPADATLAALNVTAVDPAAPGYVTVYPCGAPPEASNVNFATAAQTIANAAVVRLDAAGRVCVYTSAPTGLLIDVNGYAPAGSRLGALQPFRLYDSRREPVPRVAQQVTAVQVTGAGGVDAGAAVAALNVTAVDPLTAGYLTVYPCGEPRPEASNVNFRQGQTIANAVIARIGAGGRVCVFSSAPAGLVVDVNAGAPPAATVTGLTPSRLIDTRSFDVVPIADDIVQVGVVGVGGVPAAARTVLLNVTAADTAAPGFMTVYPCGAPQPDASNLNFGAGQTIAAAVIAKVGTEGSVCVYTSASADVVVDVGGYAV